MRAALARATAPFAPGDRADLARRQLCHRLLPTPFGTEVDDSGHCVLAGFPAGILCAAASELAHDALAARQSLVRRRDLAGAARPGPPNHHAAAPIRAMASSLNPKWRPIS